MLGCIQPMSSPMMKRILGFCCAEACVFAATTAAAPTSRLSQTLVLAFMLLSSSLHGLCVVRDLANDAAESQVACGRVHILRVPRRGAVAPAVIGRAQMRAALDDLAGDSCARLARIVAVLLAGAARILGNAARLGGVDLMLCRKPIRGPLPYIADHVVDPVTVSRECSYR